MTICSPEQVILPNIIMTKMVAMPIHGKTPSEIFSGTGGPINFNKTLHVTLWTGVL